MTRKHQHAEAYNLMPYESDDGKVVMWFWNSRDGVTPFTCHSPGTEVGLTHTNWGLDRYAPDHIPAVGDWIWVDMTDERKQALAKRMADEGPVKAGDRRYSRRGWIKVFLDSFGEGEPDLVQVTEEMRLAFTRSALGAEVK